MEAHGNATRQKRGTENLNDRAIFMRKGALQVPSERKGANLGRKGDLGSQNSRGFPLAKAHYGEKRNTPKQQNTRGLIFNFVREFLF